MSHTDRAVPQPWWAFSLDPAARASAEAARLTDAEGTPLVNAPGAEGRRAFSYADYLGLDALLAAGTPSSVVPDERVFVTIHQLFEVVFKQMTVDLGIVARTFEQLLDLDDEAFHVLALEPLPDEQGPSAFWRPAMTAAARLRHSARRVLPAVMTYVGRGEDDDVLFSTIEYHYFRDFLVPASGFQTAQLRLIQRALGKEPALSLPVFPGEAYGQHYTGCPMGHVSLGDPVVLREGHAAAFPPEDAPEATVARLDPLAHAALARLAPRAEGLPAPPSVRTLHSEEVERVAVRFRQTLGDATDAEQTAATFRTALEQAAEAENARRSSLAAARRGAQALQAHAARSCLAFVLDRIAATDTALHSPETDSFLTVHRKTVRRHVSGDDGTGGGGMPYLVTSQRFLLPLFPALAAYADLGAVVGTEEETERW